MTQTRVNLQPGRTGHVTIRSALDDTNLQAPHGYSTQGARGGVFNRRVIVENTGRTVLEGFKLIVNGKDLFTFAGLSRWLSLSREPARAAMQLFSLIRDNVFHATSRLRENDNPFKMLAYWGYGICGNHAPAFTKLLSYLEIPARRIHLNGHVVDEYRIGDSWQILDADQNMFYLKWDNENLASFRDIIADPLLAIRTKAKGKYGRYDMRIAWTNAALFEYLAPRRRPRRSRRLRDLDGNAWTLFPGERIVFHLATPPEQALGITDITMWGKARQTALRKIELRVDARARRASAGRSTITIRCRYPIYRIINRRTGQSIRLNDALQDHGDRVRTTVRLHTTPTDRQFAVFCHGARLALPELQRGSNKVQLAAHGRQGRATVTFLTAAPRRAALPRASVTRTPHVFRDRPPLFGLRADKGTSAVWSQISRTRDFAVVPPNFDSLQPFSRHLQVDKVSDTLFCSGRTYYLRVKACRNGVWGPWSEPFLFQVLKPARPTQLRRRRLRSGKVKLAWSGPCGGNTEYLVFGSDRFDFVPDIYADFQIARSGNHRALRESKNRNLLCITRQTQCALDGTHAFYRVIARRGESFSVPSELVDARQAGHKPAPHGTPRVLLVRFDRRPDTRRRGAVRNNYDGRLRELGKR